LTWYISYILGKERKKEIIVLMYCITTVKNAIILSKYFSLSYLVENSIFDCYAFSNITIHVLDNSEDVIKF